MRDKNQIMAQYTNGVNESNRVPVLALMLGILLLEVFIDIRDILHRLERK